MTEAGVNGSAMDTLLANTGEMGRLISTFDWSATALGPISGWTPGFRSTVAMMLRSPVPIAILWGPEGLMIYNDGYREIAGGRHPEVFGRPVREGWPEVADFNNNVLRTVLAGGSLSYRDQELTLLRNGTPEQVWLNLDYSPLLDGDGVPTGVIAFVAETTRRVLAERDIERGFETLRQMFEQAPGFIAILVGPEHHFAMANAAYKELVNHREVLGRPLREVLPEIIDQGFVDILDTVRRSGEPYFGEGVRILLRADPDAPPVERYLDFVFQPVTVARSGVSGIFVQGHDVTRQKLTEIALRESEQRFRLVAESAPVMLWMGDAAGKCIYLNAALRSFWGLKPEDVEGFEWSHTVHPEDADALFLPFHAAMTAHAPFSLEVRFRRADGQYRTVRTDAQPRFDASGRFEGMIGVNVDVTETRRAEEALEMRVAEEIGKRSSAEAALRQAQKMEAIGKLTGGVAHDFNNLLQIISGNLQLLMDDVTGNARAERRLANALKGVERGSRLASQLLAFGRRQALEPKVVNIGRLVTGMGDMLRRTIGESVEVDTMVAAGLWNTLVDPGQLENALINLAINARDAMDGTGTLTIEVGNAFLDDAYVAEHGEIEKGQYVVVAVTDTGAGISGDVLPLVFEPFFSTKPQGKGTGLGLSMVYGFVKQSGGHVKIYSEPGHGTTVKLYLPRVDQSEDMVLRGPAGPVTGGSETILVAEDDDAVRSTVVEILSGLGYAVLTAWDAASALNVIESGVNIDLLFTDVVMPGPLKSRELARQARERLPDIAVLFTSGYTENSIVHGGRLDKGVDLLSKPYTREALARKIRQMLTQRTQRAAADAASEGATPSPGHSLAVKASSLRVLLVEDDVLIRMNSAEMLENAGMAVVEAGSGGEALQEFQSSNIDLLVIDIGLPDMTGVELARQIRARNAAIPIIFATGHSEVPEAGELAPAKFIMKPYDIEQLRRVCSSLLEGTD